MSDAANLYSSVPLPSMPTPGAPLPLVKTRNLTNAILGIVGVYVAINLIEMFLSMTMHGDLSGESAALGVFGLLEAVAAILYLISGICFLVLVARLVRNLPRLGSGTILTPSAAVWSFLIPIVNIVGGYRTVRTIWTESQPPEVPTMTPTPVPLLGWWWGAYLLHSLIGRMIVSISGTAASLAVQCVVEMVTGILFMVVVYMLNDRQAAQHDDLTRRAPVPPRSDLLR